MPEGYVKAVHCVYFKCRLMFEGTILMYMYIVPSMLTKLLYPGR